MSALKKLKETPGAKGSKKVAREPYSVRDRAKFTVKALGATPGKPSKVQRVKNKVKRAVKQIKKKLK